MKTLQVKQRVLLFFLALPVLTCLVIPRLETNRYPRLIVISFDGFRGDYLSPSLTPTLWAIKQNGVTGSMYPLFASKTFPNHFSIATGLYEESHGIVDNEMYDPEMDEIFKKTNMDPKWWDNGYSLPLWIANELSGGTSGVIMWPGCCTEYGGLSASYSYKYNGSMSIEERADILFDWMTNPENPANLVFLYINQPDSLSHVYGPYSNQVLQIVRSTDRFAAYLMDGLEKRFLAQDTNVIFLSDHGMTHVTHFNSVNLTKILDTSLFRFFGESQVVGILPNEGKFDQVYQMLVKHAPDNHYKVYLKSDIPKEYAYSKHHRIMPIIIEAESGYEITFSRWIHKSPTWGNHGNNNTQLDMRSLFIAIGPNFKQGYQLNETPFFNIDLYPIMAKILQINVDYYKFNGTDRFTRKFLC